MSAKMKINLLLLVLYVISDACYGEIFLDEDRPYDPIEIKVPLSVWKQAVNPSPVLKSGATVVLPIHVEDEYLDSDDADNDVDEELIDESDIANQTAVVEQISDLTVIENEVVPLNQSTSIVNDSEEPVQTTSQPEPQQPVIFGQGFRFPCACNQGQCGCCTNMNLQWLRTNTCGNISFVPEDFVFDVRLSVNNNTVIRRRVSASDPPPICFNPRRVPFVRVCLEISNIRIRNRNAFACLDITADIAEFPIYTASFRCFGLGTSGVQTGLKPKPVSSGPTPVDLFASPNADSDGGSLIGNAASAVIGGTESGDGLLGGANGGILFGGGGGSDDEGPLDAISDAIGSFFE